VITVVALCASDIVKVHMVSDDFFMTADYTRCAVQ